MYTLDRLLKTKPGEDAKSTVDRPLDHLVACHNRIEERLWVLERVVDNWESKPEEARQALDSVFRYFESSGVMHTEDEEQSVFPRIQGRLTEGERAYLADLERQHREADRLYEQLKQAPRGPEELARYRDVVRQFAALYRAHIASENDRLIAVGRRVLSPGELDAISIEMKKRRGFL